MGESFQVPESLGLIISFSLTNTTHSELLGHLKAALKTLKSFPAGLAEETASDTPRGILREIS